MRFREFRRAGHLPTLLAALLYFDTSFMAWMLLGALGAYVSADLSLTPIQKGLMVAVPPLAGAGFRLLLGGLADIYGARRVGVAGAAATTVPLAWGALAGSTFAETLGIGVLLGIAGASFAVALPLASRSYPPEHQGLVLGIAGAGNSGTIVAALAAPPLAERLGWHTVFGLALVPVAAGGLALALFAREPGPAPRRRASPLALAREPDARRLAYHYTVTFGGFVGLAAYLPMLLVDRFGVEPVTAAALTALCAATASVLRPIGGLLADRRGGGPVLERALATVAALALVLVLGPPLPTTVVALLALLGALGIGNGAVFQLVPQRFPGRVGLATGLVGAAGGLGGFALPFAFGIAHQATGSPVAGFALLVGAALGASVAIGRQRRTVWLVEVAR